MAENQVQNWDIADALLIQLYECRPDKILFDDLKKRLPQFIETEEEWVGALKGLSDAGLAEVVRAASGIQGKWGAVVSAGITKQGEREVTELRAIEEYSSLRFQDWSERLYADFDREGGNLREKYAQKGLLASSSFYRAATRLVLGRLQTLDDAFMTNYLRTVQERTAEGVGGLRERWLRRKLETTWETQIKRAKGIAAGICEISGRAHDQFAPQIAELGIEGDALRLRMLRKLESAAIGQKIPVRRLQPTAVSNDEPTPTQPGKLGRSNTGPKDHLCAVILTALSIEYIAVRNHLKGVREETHPQETVYEIGRFEGLDGTEWEVAIAEIGPGNSNAALEAERAMRHFEPQVALFVGVAGGLKDDVALGDVVAATHVYGYESGKAERKFLPRPSVASSSYGMIQRAQAEAKRRGWLNRIGVLKTAEPKALVKPICAGEKVVAERRSEVYQFIQLQYGDAVAVEMEGRGFLEAAHANPDVRCLVVRGISDLIDRKGDTDVQGWQQIAARNAAAFAFEVLSKLKQHGGGELILGDEHSSAFDSSAEAGANVGNIRNSSIGCSFKKDPQIDALIKDVKLGAPNTAVKPALEIIKAINTPARSHLFDALLGYVDIPDDEDTLWQALSTIERCAELAPSLFDRRVLVYMSKHPNFSVRSSAASICWTLGGFAPELVPVDLLIKLSAHDEDWYVEAPANAALKTMARSMPAVLCIFLLRLSSADADERKHAAHHIADIAEKDPDLLDGNELEIEVSRLRGLGDKEASDLIAKALPAVRNASRRGGSKYGM